MTKDEIIRKNIALTFDFLRYLINHAEVLDTLPENAEIDFVELDLPIRVPEDRLHASSDTVLFRVEHTFSTIP
jgi:hypothetical protein